MQITPLADKTIKHYGQIRADLQQRGLIIGNNDLWLAADAHAEGWALVTNSEHVFIRVNGLNIEN
ncbi:MAG: ribonuclease VapC [Pseudomonadota bacterium]|jgi:tRNA(fMet)-specific endonuclease VapC